MTHSEDTPNETFNIGEQALDISLKCGDLVTSLSRSLFILRQKRTTLEEKAIARYFHQSAQLLGLIVSKLHLALGEDADANLRHSTLDLLRSTVQDLQTRVDELLKILHYNVNFLEQYFEYDFYNKLTNESHTLENLQRVCEETPPQWSITTDKAI